MCKIEVKLASQDQFQDSLDWIVRELDAISGLDSLFKTHENDLNEMMSLHENLKETIEKVRTKPLNDDNSNDLDKLTIIIKQLNIRWKNSIKNYIERFIFDLKFKTHF